MLVPERNTSSQLRIVDSKLVPPGETAYRAPNPVANAQPAPTPEPETVAEVAPPTGSRRRRSR